jgi:hypothetical protein
MNPFNFPRRPRDGEYAATLNTCRGPVAEAPVESNELFGTIRPDGAYSVGNRERNHLYPLSSEGQRILKFLPLFLFVLERPRLPEVAALRLKVVAADSFRKIKRIRDEISRSMGPRLNPGAS